MSNCFSKTEYFQKAQNYSDRSQSVAKCLWLVFSELLEERRCRLLKRQNLEGKGVYGYTQKRLNLFLRRDFIGKFSQQAKVPRFRGGGSSFDILLQLWPLIRSKLSSNFSNRKTPSYRQSFRYALTSSDVSAYVSHPYEVCGVCHYSK